MTTLGFVTIGQAPRDDVTPSIVAQLPDDIDVTEVGALDEFDSAAAIESTLPPRPDEPIFVTRLRDGSSVTIDRAGAIERTQARIADIEDEVEAICLLCTGYFPEFEAAVPILEPSPLLQAWARGITPEGRIGLVIPHPEQRQQVESKWREFETVTAAGSPYVEEDAVTPAAEELAGADPDLIVMDCIGYTEAMRRTVRSVTGAGTLLARSVLWKTATELR